MSAPRTKRPFAGASADPAQRQITSFFTPKSPTDSTDSQKPILPSAVEANLLSVGMRVRKSVPEGYKTVGTSAFKLWTDTTPLPVTSAAPKGVRASSRELLPFCGINKVGGLDTQPEFNYEDGYEDEDMEVPELTMSQESTTDSVGSVSEASRKRVFDEDEGEEYGVLVAEDFADGRVLAIPQSRMHKSLNGSGLKGHVAADNDFEDANFLVEE